MLRWSAVPLLIAIVAAVFGFREGSPAVTGAATVISFFFALFFVVLAGAGLYARRRSG